MCFFSNVEFEAAEFLDELWVSLECRNGKSQSQLLYAVVKQRFKHAFVPLAQSLDVRDGCELKAHVGFRIHFADGRWGRDLDAILGNGKAAPDQQNQEGGRITRAHE